jgi:hypothetical protein
VTIPTTSGTCKTSPLFCSVKSDAAASAPGAVGERKEEGIALRVDLDAAVSGARLANRRSVRGEHLRVRLRAELVQERGRALDVREEQPDRWRARRRPIEDR